MVRRSNNRVSTNCQTESHAENQTYIDLGLILIISQLKIWLKHSSSPKNCKYSVLIPFEELISTIDRLYLLLMINLFKTEIQCSIQKYKKFFGTISYKYSQVN